VAVAARNTPRTDKSIVDALGEFGVVTIHET
jgi:hypothetical protein